MLQSAHTLPQLRQSFVQVNGMRLHWAEMGHDDALPPVVLLHGLVDSHLTWTKVAAKLARRRRVLMPDLPGCGLSDRPDASYELQWHADTIAAWLDALGLSEVDMVGHSFGGGVAQMLLLKQPLPMRRLVLVSSGGLGRDVGFWLRLASIPAVVEHFGQPFMSRCTRLALRGAGLALAEPYVSQLSAMNARQGTARAFARTVRDVIDWRGQRRYFFERCHEVELPPTAVFWGDRDPIIPFAHGKGFVDAFSGITFERFADCGHYPHHERPEAFVRAVEDFLQNPAVPALHVRSNAPLPARAPLFSFG
jgi:pimeloyl-ACP methyl ester carboxylesterase